MILVFIYSLTVIVLLVWILSIVISTRKEVGELRNLLNTHMIELKKRIREK